MIVLGFAATTMHDDDRYALDLLQEACSDLGSRLFLRVREKNSGLAYYVRRAAFPRTRARLFCILRWHGTDKSCAGGTGIS